MSLDMSDPDSSLTEILFTCCTGHALLRIGFCKAFLEVNQHLPLIKPDLQGVKVHLLCFVGKVLVPWGKYWSRGESIGLVGKVLEIESGRRCQSKVV